VPRKGRLAILAMLRLLIEVFGGGNSTTNFYLDSWESRA